jgi:NAD(P)H-hydrate epimerase
MALKCGVFCLPAKRWLEGAKKNIIWPENYAKSCFPKAVALPDIIIDGLVGSGFTPPLDASLTELVLAINCLKDHSTILALDSPSGLDKNGLPAPVAIAAKHTVSFQTQKLNLILPSAREYSGVVHLRSVGIPLLAQEALPTRMRVLEPACLRALPGPAPDLHKGKAGRVLIIGGTPGLTGAPVLAAMGALRGGAGLVTIACPAGLALEIKSGLPDIMTLPVGTGSDWDLSCLPLLIERAGDCDALVLGPGLGRSAGALSVVQGFLRQTQDVPGKRAPAVIDADALYALSINKDYLLLPAGNDILTPHPLEMARLLEGCENANAGNVLEDRPGSLDAFIKKCKAAITLKGPCSLITQAGRSVYVSPIAAPCLAVGGSGDVLSGLLATLLAQGIPPLPAACLGVYWHGQAGILLEKDYPCRGNSAREIADMLPKVRLL